MSSPHHPARATRALLLGVLACAALASACGRGEPGQVVPRAGAVAPPESQLGFRIGTSRRLADWNEVAGYLESLAESSARVRLDTLGASRGGHPLLMATITSPLTLRRLDEFRQIQDRLADPRQVETEAEAERLISQGKTVVLVIGSADARQVSPSQAMLRLAYRLASSDAEADRRILERTIVLLVPAVDPEGVQRVVEWYRGTLGQTWEGMDPPFPPHAYAGAELTGDWYALTQAETRAVVEGALNRWRPQVVLELHEGERYGARILLPPFRRDVEPDVDPLLVSAAAAVGTHVAWRLEREGLRGVLTRGTRRAGSTLGAYARYHGGTRILMRVAPARLASPEAVPPDSLRRSSPEEGTFSRPTQPWPGGEWTLADIVAYTEAGALAVLGHAATNREQWLRSYVEVGKKALTGWPGWPVAWVIPADQPNRAGVDEILRVLTTGDVEVRRAEAPFRAGGQDFSAGTYVVSMRQPFAAFAQAVLEPQRSGFPPPLPLMLGVGVVPMHRLEGGILSLSAPLEVPAGLGPGESSVAAPATGRWPRIVLYRGAGAESDLGWTRSMLEGAGIPFAELDNAGIRQGALGRAYDVLILPAQSSRMLAEGRSPGPAPSELVGGLGPEGTRELERFLEEGGTLLAFGGAAEFVVEALDLRVQAIRPGGTASERGSDGTAVRILVPSDHPLRVGLPETIAAWFDAESVALAPRDPAAAVIARYAPVAESSAAQNGEAVDWVEQVAGEAAMVESRVGRGRVLLFGFRPNQLGYAASTAALVLNALRVIPGEDGTARPPSR